MEKRKEKADHKYRIVQEWVCYFIVQKRILFWRITIGDAYGYLDAEKIISRCINPYKPKITNYDKEWNKID
jgi:hypothetical protein